MRESLKVSNGANLNQWAGALQHSHPKAAKALSANRKSGLHALEVLELPRLKKVTGSLTDFFNDPEIFFDELSSNQYWAIAQPLTENAKRISASGLDRDQVIPFLKANVIIDEISQFELVLQDYFKNIYGGSVIINQSGYIHAEFKEGKQGPIAKGTSTPDHFMTRDPFRGIFEYSFDDIALRQAMYRTIRHIPHYGSGRETAYNQGYYEFALVEKSDGAPLTTIFFDHQQSSAFEVPEI